MSPYLRNVAQHGDALELLLAVNRRTAVVSREQF
jgi:hypothetical protein